MAHFIFNVPQREAAGVVALLRSGMWGVDGGERHADSLAAGDDVLVYLGAPQREFVARAGLASAVREWTSSEALKYPANTPTGVLLARVEEWRPPVPMSVVLREIDPTERAKADFDVGIVRITTHEYETALAVAAAHGSLMPSAGGS